MDPETKAFFRGLRDADPGNSTCIDCGTPSPQWATVSYGGYMCLTCSGVHRSLGVHLSFVRSITMDTWNERQMKKMKVGGNGPLRQFFQEHGIPEDMPIPQKYNTKAAEYYRELIKAKAEGLELPAAPAAGTGAEQSDLYSSQSRAVNNDPAPIYGGAPAAPSYHSSGGSEGFGSNPADSSGYGERFGAGLPSAIPGDVGQKVSQGLFSAMGLASKLANAAKTTAQATVKKAQDDGLFDAVGNTVNTVGSTVAATATSAASWTAERAKTVQETVTDEDFLNKTRTSIAGVAQQVQQNVKKGLDTSTDWFAEHLTEERTGNDGSHLQSMSTGTMQGIGSADVGAPAPPAKAQEPKKDIWDDEDWGEWDK